MADRTRVGPGIDYKWLLTTVVFVASFSFSVDVFAQVRTVASDDALNTGSARVRQLKDPTVPLAGRVKKKKIETLVLSGIYYREGGFVAVFNGRSVRVGDSLEGKKIKKINSNSVVLFGQESNPLVLFGKVTINE